MQYESTKFFSPTFSFHDGYEQFAKFFACQIFPLYGTCAIKGSLLITILSLLGAV